MVDVRVTRTAQVPDPMRVQRYQKAPELGPRLLFFSGGSALNDISRQLQHYSHNTIHLVTPFDSGGSSAKLREAFDMPAIGDLRSRLMALADGSILGHPEVYRLFTHRLPQDASADSLRTTLDQLTSGRHPLISDISPPMRRLICNQLGFFHEAMPTNFDLRGASIGNLILAGGYLNNHQQLDPIIFLFSKLVHVRGTVRAMIDRDYHLAVTLEDGSQVSGQHRITGKEVAPLTAPIADIALSASRDSYVPVAAKLRKQNRRLIASAELICYPPGSFYSSLLANLLPSGVGQAIRANHCPKVYIPNSGPDPEQNGKHLEQLIGRLLDTLRRDIDADCPPQELLDFVLIDSERGDYPGSLSADFLAELGVTLIDTRLISEANAPHYDPKLLVTALMSLV